MQSRRWQRFLTAGVILLVIVGIGALLWITITSDSEEEAHDEAMTSPSSQTGASAAAVTIQDFLYKPAAVGVAVGGKVTWTQRDIVAHTVTSGRPGEPGAGALFDKTLPEVGDTYTFDFQQAGTTPYFCRFHPQMLGNVAVGEAVAQAQPSPSPTSRPFSTVPTGVVQSPPPGATLVAGGLTNPRGFTWGPDGALYVAQAGTPGALNLPGTQSVESRVSLLFCEGWTQQTGEPPPALCPQDVPQRLRTGRISRVAADGRQHVIVDGLPVIAGMFGFAEGPASVAFIGNDLYVLMAAENNSPANQAPREELPSGVYKVNQDGTGTLIANLYQFNRTTPPSVVPPDWGWGELYDMIAANGKLYASDANASVIFEIDPAAPAASRVRRLADLSGTDGDHPVLTGLALGPDNNLYVTNLQKAPYPPGGAKVWRITPSGEFSVVATGFTLGVGLAVAPDSTFYVAEFAKIAAGQTPPIVPGGRVMRARAGGTPSVMLESLFYPTVIRRGPDGMIYLTYFSIGADNGTTPGAIYRVAP